MNRTVDNAQYLEFVAGAALCLPVMANERIGINALRAHMDRRYHNIPRLVMTFQRSKPATVASAAADLNYLAEKYVSHRAWLRVADRPVIFLYGRAMGQLGGPRWIETLDRARGQDGTDWLAVADGLHSSYGALFDGIDSYNTMGQYLKQPETAWPDIARRHMNRSIALARPRGHIACATIVPGYGPLDFSRTEQ